MRFFARSRQALSSCIGVADSDFDVQESRRRDFFMTLVTLVTLNLIWS